MASSEPAWVGSVSVPVTALTWHHGAMAFRTFRRVLTTVGVIMVATTLATAAPAWANATWPTYHGTPDRQGVDANEVPLAPSTQAWRASLDAAVYGQPLVANGRIYAATENNTVSALDAHDGTVLWSTHVGRPLTGVAGATGCGNIDPLGITSTPVIDPATGILYVVAEMATGGGPSVVVGHQLVGLDPYTGATVSSANADPPIASVAPAGQNLKWLQQRGALAVANGRVYVAYGGLDGDCGIYHGWLVGVDQAGARANVAFSATAGGQGGAIWGPSGPAVDASGDLYVSTGNPNNPDVPPVGYSESVVKLSPALVPLASYRDTNATDDADLATDGVTVLPGGLIFTVGKTDIGYLLQQGNLALVAAIPNVCGGDPVGGNAYLAATNTLYVPCRGGSIQPVDLTGHRAGTAISGVNGPPILADGMLWAVSYPGSSLYEINPSTGAKTQTLPTGAPVASFASPVAADGLVLVGTTTGVTAFAGPGGPPAPASPPPTTTPPPTTAYTALPPTRVTDTRPMSGEPSAGRTLVAGGSLSIPLPSTVPATATAVALSVTAVDASAPGFLSVNPGSSASTATSVLNFGAAPANSSVPDGVVPNLAISQETGNQVTVVNGAAGTVNVVVDLEGFFDPNGATTSGAGHYLALPSPSRLADTRCGTAYPLTNCADESLPTANAGLTTVSPGKTINVAVGGNSNPTAGGVSAAVVQLTATDTAASGFLTAYGTGTAQPTASNVNFATGQTTSTRAIVPVGANGDISIYNFAGSTDVVVDVVGYFTNSSVPATFGSLFTPVAPSRVIDTRAFSATGLGSNAAGPVPITGVAGIPSRVNGRPTAAALNITEAADTSPGFLTVSPNPIAPPATTSDVNFSFPGEIRANADLAGLGSTGGVSVYNYSGNTQVIIDAFGYFSAA